MILARGLRPGSRIKSTKATPAARLSAEFLRLAGSTRTSIAHRSGVNALVATQHPLRVPDAGLATGAVGAQRLPSRNHRFERGHRGFLPHIDADSPGS